MISKEAASAVPLPAMVDEQHPQSPTEPTGNASFLTFYTKSLELYEILSDILLSLYKNPTLPDRPEDSHHFYFNSFDDGQLAVFRLDHALSTWSQSLPSHLRSSSPASSTHPIIDRQSLVLRSRYEPSATHSSLLDCLSQISCLGSFMSEWFFCGLFYPSTATCIPESLSSGLMTPFHNDLPFSVPYSV